MGFNKIKDLHNLNIEEINENIFKLKKEILDLQIRKFTKQSIKNHEFKHKKHEIAQLLTLKTNKYGH
uniref:ribosomal protein L29 n=1 Tax=Hypnea pseudomusciformis TaxID=1545697 RepID=UPI0027DAA874|nr:ribosomal protein L29 [Hypnea pseudomusciformis]WCH55174.1 ribosomal protein L29 [Hypnea pseudomusciformis]WCH56767.1 ribosomal protein L29 [Hypnea pseudomusciformis]